MTNTTTPIPNNPAAMNTGTIPPDETMTNTPPGTPPAATPGPLKVREFAAELGISMSLVYKLLTAGKVRHERYGLGRGTIRIPRAALDEYRKAAAVERPAGPNPAGLRHITLR